MSLKKITACVLFAIASSSVYAMPNTSDRTLEGGVIAPNQTLTISLDKLTPGAPYDITCTLVSDHKANQAVDDLLVNSTCFSLNGAPVTCNSPVAHLPVSSGPVTVMIPNVNTSMIDVVKYTNLDDTDTLTASDCVARIH